MPLIAESLIRDVKDFPKEGIIFKDITPVLSDPAAFSEVVQLMTEYAEKVGADAIAGIESRGFIFGAPIAVALSKPFIPIRKLGKLPAETIRVEYDLEYGSNTVEMHKDAILPGQRVLVVDDLLATGGTAAAAAELIERGGGEVAGFVFMVELAFLEGREALAPHDALSLLTY